LIHILKLTNGDTILTEIGDADEKTLQAINPLELRTEPYGRNQANMVANQWLPLVENPTIIYLSQSHIVGTMRANEELVDFYEHAIESVLYPKEETKRHREEREFYEKMLAAVRAANTNGVVH
jgi:hypothetical protein